MEAFLARPLVLVTVRALCDAAATVAMKTASVAPQFPVILALVLLLCGAVFFEILLLRRLEIGVVYLMILGLEALAILTYAFFIGEGLSGKEITGAVLVFAGTATLAI